MAATWPAVLTTGHDGQGKSVFIESAEAKQATPLTRVVYGTCDDGPVNVNGDADLSHFAALDLAKSGFIPTHGCRVMAGEFPPGTDRREDLHRTLSVDIVIVVEGQGGSIGGRQRKAGRMLTYLYPVTCHLDSGQIQTIGTGGVLIQRGTMHSWSNPSKTQAARIVGLAFPSLAVEGAAPGKVIS